MSAGRPSADFTLAEALAHRDHLREHGRRARQQTIAKMLEVTDQDLHVRLRVLGMTWEQFLAMPTSESEPEPPVFLGSA
jgi:hypothetical protein